MRSGNSYRSARRRRAKQDGTDWGTFQSVYYTSRARALAAMQAKALKLSPEQARRALARWAASGGKLSIEDAAKGDA